MGKTTAAKQAEGQKTGSVSEQVLDEIRSRIASGDLKENDKIPTEAELAKQFNVSRASVREAIKTLDYLGIVDSRTSRGTRITGKTRLLEKAASWTAVLCCEDIQDAFVLGTALDTQAAVIVSEKLHYDHNEHSSREEMIQILSQMAFSAVQKDEKTFDENFYAFFRRFYDFAGNEIFISLNECINSLIHERVSRALHKTGKMLEATSYLNDIWNAVISYRKQEAIEMIQEYGAFAWDIVIHSDNQEKQDER